MLKASPLTLALLLLSSLAQAQTVAQASSTLPGVINLGQDFSISGKMDNDISFNTASQLQPRLRTKDAEITLAYALREGVRAIVETELETALAQSGPGSVQTPFQVKQAIEQAYIEITTDKNSALPIAKIIFGKQRVAFADGLSNLPMQYDNLLYSITRLDKVIGLTLVMRPGLLKVIDEAAVSVFEGGRDDLSIAPQKGVSANFKKNWTKRFHTTIAVLYRQLPSANAETRESVSTNYDSADGKTNIFIEGVSLQNNSTYLHADYTYAAGVSRVAGPGAVAIEYAFVQRYAKEFAVAYNWPIGQRLILSPEIRRDISRLDGKPDTTRFGIRSRLKL